MIISATVLFEGERGEAEAFYEAMNRWLDRKSEDTDVTVQVQRGHDLISQDEEDEWVDD